MIKEFKVGDRVKIKKSVSKEWYSAGAEGIILDVDLDLFVKFDKGNYDTCCDGEWYVNFDEAKVIKQTKEKEMKSKGYGLGEKSEGDGIGVTKAWAVEVDGKLHSSLVFGTREEARLWRTSNAVAGHKAHVRRTEIKVLKHKV